MKTYEEYVEQIRKTNDIRIRLEEIYLLTITCEIDFDMFAKLTKAFWKGIDGVG